MAIVLPPTCKTQIGLYCLNIPGIPCRTMRGSISGNEVKKNRGKNRGTEATAVLSGLAHGNLKDQEIIRGFIEYYILNNLHLATVESDFTRCTLCPAECIRAGIERLRRVLEQAATDGLSTNKNARLLEQIYDRRR